MSTVTARFPRAAAWARTERFAGALPLLTIYVWLCLIYGWEAWGNLTPWLFGDELEHTQLARAIADTGHAARRGVPHSPDSIYSYLTAPAWLVHKTHVSYGLVKAFNVVVMTASIFPAYALARLLVSRRTALVTAATAAAVPALAYSSLILEEPLAYTWSILCVWLAVRAFVTPTRRWVVAAALASLVAPAVRGELTVIPAALVLAYAVWWFIGDGGRAWRNGWQRGDWLGLGLLAAGAVIFLNSVAAQRSAEWLSATQHYKGRMLENGLWAIGALVIGLGVLPLIAGVAALFPGRWSTRPREERAFLCVAATILLGFGWYTAVKAAYISTVFSTLVEERNAIYAAPVLLVATALFLERRRTHPLAIAAAAVFGFYLIVRTPFHMYEHFYADAPGLSILQSANRVLRFTPGDAQWTLLILLAVSTAVVGLLATNRRVHGGVIVGLLGFLLAWNLTGEITGARSSHELADRLLANLPRPLDWVDKETGGTPTVYYGQRLSPLYGGDPNGLWQLEFWNRSIQGVWTVDGSGVGPGPTVTPDVLKPDGRIRVIRRFDYAVADEGINLVGDVLARKQHLAGGGIATWTLYRVAHPMRLRNNVEGVLPDGWVAAPRDTVDKIAHSAYSQFSTPSDRAGYLVVHVSRAGGGKTLPANVNLRVGTLVIGKDTQPNLGEVLFGRKRSVQQNLDETFVVDAPPAPFRAEVEVWPTFRPIDLDPLNGDVRNLGAQVSYTFLPKLPPPVIGKAPQTEGVYADGWMGGHAAYTQWHTPRGASGEVTVTLSRPAGPLPARLEIRIGRLRNHQVGNAVELGVTRATTRTVRLTRNAQTITLRAPKAPFRVELRGTPTFVPAQLNPGANDTRTLSARVSFASR